MARSSCLIVCIISDPETGRSYWCDGCPNAKRTPDKHGNVVAQEGCTRCFCGSKYWKNDRCVDCGTAAAEVIKESVL